MERKGTVVGKRQRLVTRVWRVFPLWVTEALQEPGEHMAPSYSFRGPGSQPISGWNCPISRLAVRVLEGEPAAPTAGPGCESLCWDESSPVDCVADMGLCPEDGEEGGSRAPALTRHV